MEVRMDNGIEFARVLRERGFRATFGRVALLEVLQSAGRPVPVEYIVARMHRKLDQANAYRALEAFVKAGLVRRIDFGQDYAQFELVEEGHHHHLVCDSCGKVADVEIAEEEMERAALRAARDFSSVRTHSLEFFGICNACVA